MYLSQREKLVEIIQTARQVLVHMAGSGEQTLIQDVMDGVEAGYQYAEWAHCEPEYLKELDTLRTWKPDITADMNEWLEGICLFNHAIRRIKKIKVRHKAVFLPYKASMWTSMESVWRAASEDEDCDTTVMPIPYVDLKTREILYEINDFPKDVPVIAWDQMNLDTEEPDMVFIHNPYDNQNNLTSVIPKFYSGELKKITRCLVYMPYFTLNNYTPGKNDFHYLVPAAENADKIAVQSPAAKGIYMKQYHYPTEKLIAMGSPKIDAVIHQRDVKMPEIWREKLEGKKIFLLNTHLSYFPSASISVDTFGFNYAEKYHKDILAVVRNRKDCGLIWRPHPLMRMMMNNRFQECLKFVDWFRKRIEDSDNCVIDEQADYSCAFRYSDAMITTYSSLLNEYLVTGKPVMIFQGKPSDETAERSPMDLRTCYFRFKSDGGLYFREFRDMILAGEDPKYEERMRMLRTRAFANMDGTAGKHIYECVKQYVRRSCIAHGEEKICRH